MTSEVVVISCTLMFGGGVITIFRALISLGIDDSVSVFSLAAFEGDDEGDREGSWEDGCACIDT